VKKQNSFQF